MSALDGSGNNSGSGGAGTHPTGGSGTGPKIVGGVA